MKKIVIILLTLSISLFGYTSIKKLKFESGITIYGQIGFVDVELTQNFDNNTYEMKATATSIGAVKYLTDNKKYIFISEGKIDNGVYIPFKFTKQTLKEDYDKTTTYIFDYEQNKVLKTVYHEKYEIQSVFDVSTFGYKDVKKRVINKDESTLELYPNDYLSLYLNMKSNNLNFGQVFYVDKKDKDSLFYTKKDLVEVHKNHGEDTYDILVHHDKESIFFKKIESVGVSFYGDAYIKKISETTDIITEEN